MEDKISIIFSRVWDTLSWQTWGLSPICTLFGDFKCIVKYSTAKSLPYLLILPCIHRCTGSLAVVDTDSLPTKCTASWMVGVETGRLVISAGERGFGIMCSCPLWINTCTLSGMVHASERAHEDMQQCPHMINEIRKRTKLVQQHYNTIHFKINGGQPQAWHPLIKVTSYLAWLLCVR